VRPGSSWRHPPIQRSAMAFMRGVRTLHSTVLIPAAARPAPEAAVKFGARSWMMNLTWSACSPGSMIRLRACWLAHCPVGCGVAPGDADAPGRVLGHGQDAGLGAAAQAGAEEVACEDRPGPGSAGTAARPSRSVVAGRDRRRWPLRISHTSGAATRGSQAGPFTVDPAVPPSGVLACEPADQGLDVPPCRRPAGPSAHGPGGPGGGRWRGASAGSCPGGQQPQPLAAHLRYHACQGREQRAVRPRQLRAGRRLALQDHKLLAQDHDLGDLLRLLTPGQPQPRGEPSDQEEDQPQAHESVIITGRPPGEQLCWSGPWMRFSARTG
jgi:hypothetical protein